MAVLVLNGASSTALSVLAETLRPRCAEVRGIQILTRQP